MATQPVIKHNTLDGRSDKDAHTIDSITDLKSSLAVLKSDATAIAGYCAETTNARDVSISHASIAVAEAAQTAAHVRKFQHLSAELARTEEHVAGLVVDLEAQVVTFAESAESVQRDRRAAEEAAAAAARSSVGVAEVAAQIDYVSTVANQISSQVSYVSEAVRRVEAAVTSTETNAALSQSIQEDIDNKALQIDTWVRQVEAHVESAQTAAASTAIDADRAAAACEEATRHANNARAYRDTIEATAESLRETVANAEELGAIIGPAVDSVERNTALAQEAAAAAGQYALETQVKYESILGSVTDVQEHAALAQQAAQNAATSKTQALNNANAALSYADSARVMAEEAVAARTAASAAKQLAEQASLSARQEAERAEGAADRAEAAVISTEEAIQFRGAVADEFSLPQNPQSYDVYQIGDEFMLWNGTEWRPIGGRALGGSVALNASDVSDQDLESLGAQLKDGVFVSVLELQEDNH